MPNAIKYLSCCLLQALLYLQPAVALCTEADTSSTGLHIKKNSLYIAKNGTGLYAFSDVYLDSVTSVGEGVLGMKSHHPQTLVALESRVAHLVIDNLTGVKLRGSLTITDTLQIRHGVFDTRLGNLRFSTHTEVVLGKQAQLLLPNQQHWGLSKTGTVSNRNMASFANLVFHHQLSYGAKLRYSINMGIRKDLIDSHWRQDISPPPEVLSKNTKQALLPLL